MKLRTILCIAASLLILISSCRKEKNRLEDYKDEMDAAMMKMMDEMNAVPMTMDPDIDFANMMKAHHQGAINMVDVLTKYSDHNEMEDMAAKIRSGNVSSIERLNQYLSSHGPAVPSGNSSAFDAKMDQGMKKMHESMMAHHFTIDPDYDFAQMMIHHHQGAIDMSKAELEFGVDSLFRQESQKIISEQEPEIIELAGFLNSHGEPEKHKK
jgi:uncharacterized protein (DUF305 family)